MWDEKLLNVLAYSGLAGGGTLLGMYIVLRRQEWVQKNTIFLISFAAGVLLAAAFTELIPESLRLTEWAVGAVLLSFLGFYILEQYTLFHTHHHEHIHDSDGSGRFHSMGLVSFVGLAFHSLLDGIIIGAGFEVDFSLGLVAAIGVISHEIPEGISIVSILLYGGFSRRATTLYSWVVALATPLGAIVAIFALPRTSEQVLGVLLAVAAGSFIYIAASDLIPETHHNQSVGSVFLVIGGAMLIFAARAVLG